MTEQDLKSLEAAPPLMLAEWYCLLNKWEWPREGLGEPDPKPDRAKKWNRDTRRGQIMQWIVRRIGEKACSREWNREMADEEFEAWWNSPDNLLCGGTL